MKNIKILILKVIMFLAYPSISVRLKSALKAFIMVFWRRTTFYPPEVFTLHKNFSGHTKKKYAVSFCNGTSALEAIGFALDLSDKSKVAIPDFGFQSTFMPLLNNGVAFDFYGYSTGTLMPDREELESVLNNKVSAIVICSLFANNLDENAIVQQAQKSGAYVIHDCSHSHFSSYKNEWMGSKSDISFFSLQGGKAVPAGEGAIVATDNLRWYKKMVYFGHFNNAQMLSNEPQMGIDLTDKTFGFGRKLRMHPIGASIANTYFSFYKNLSIRNNVHRNITSFVKLTKNIGLIESVLVCDENSHIGNVAMGVPVILADSIDFERFKVGFWGQFLTDVRYINYLKSIRLEDTSETPDAARIAKVDKMLKDYKIMDGRFFHLSPSLFNFLVKKMLVDVQRCNK